MAQKKEIEEVLFPERVVHIKSLNRDVVIKPWSFGELVKINADIEEIFSQLEKRGTSIDFDNFGFVTMKNIYFSSMAKIGDIIVKTVPNLTQEELNALSMTEVMPIAMNIFHANRDSLKNVFRPFWFMETEQTGAETKESKEK